MGYPLELDEMSDFVLAEEMERRRKCKQTDGCPYCKRHITEPPCKISSNHRPRIIVLCGSTRDSFKPHWQEVNAKYTLLGYIVLSVGNFKSDSLTEEQKSKLDRLHFKKIDMADDVYIINVGGYIGRSTANEIRYAKGLSKSILYHENPVT